jgi:hypothetical protein
MLSIVTNSSIGSLHDDSDDAQSQSSPQSVIPDKMCGFELDKATTKLRLDHLKVSSETRIASHKESLGTQIAGLKTNVHGFITDVGDLTTNFNAFQSDMKSDMNAFRSDMNVFKSDMNVFKSDVQRDMDAFRSDIKSDLNAFRSDMEDFRSDMKAELNVLSTKLDSKFGSKSDELHRLTWRIVFVVSHVPIFAMIYLLTVYRLYVASLE